MAQIIFALIVCQDADDHQLVILDMTDTNRSFSFPLYEAEITPSGLIVNVHIFPMGLDRLQIEKTPVVEDALDEVGSMTPEDIERLALNQLGHLNKSTWESFDEGCYQRVTANFDELLELGGL